MSISIRIIQRTDKINRDNTAPIHLRLTHKGKSRYVSTGITLPLDTWSAETQQINPDYPSAGELQFKVDSVRNEYEKKIKRLQTCCLTEKELVDNHVLYEQNKSLPN